MAIASTVARVPDHTTVATNRKIARQIERNITYYSMHPEEIDARLEELDREWDIERALETHAAAITLLSVGLGIVKNRAWLFFPAIVGAFLMQHAIQGWCPPLPILRRMGFRTQPEIERERYALKAMRGDYNPLLVRNEENILPS